ncbi:MAG: polysaccharide biosynthesis tyrosine autokinase [Synechococcaceae cyanobacterium]|nr:polysaccharide biosynthesis tyrosine autokinase [Synechococcaceae cyanobacterium]
MTGSGSSAPFRPAPAEDRQESGRRLDAPPPRQEEDGIDFGSVLQGLQRRRRLAVSVLVSTLIAGAGVTAWQRTFHPTYQGSLKLLVSDPIDQSASGRSQSGEANLETLALPGRGANDTNTLIQVLTSALLLAPVEQRLGLPAGSLESQLTVSTSRGGRNAQSSDGVLEVTLLWPNPEQGEAILQQVGRDYLAYSLRQRQEKLTQGLAFLDQQAPALQQRMNLLQSRLARFRQANGFLAPEQQAQAILSQRQGLVGQLETLQQEQARLRGRLAAVRRGDLGTSLGSSPALMPGAGITAPSTTPPSGKESDPSARGAVANAPALQPLQATSTPLQDLNEVESALAEAEANYTNSSPQVLELRAKRDRLRPLLQRRQQAELLADLSQNLSQQQEIEGQLQRLNLSFAANPVLIKQYDDLQQQLDVARANLSSYIEARENFRLQMAQRTVPWSVLSPARFGGQPVKPSLVLNLSLSLLLGAAAGIGAALLRDRLDHVFHDPIDLRDSLPVPLLGVVPHLSGAEGTTIAAAVKALGSGQRFEIRESLRNVFANFRLLRADKTVRLVAITSASQGEGKSTTTALFALTLAQLGQKVLLVDADMRRPMLHRYLGAENGVGLSSLLTDPSIPIGEALVSVQPELDLLPAGPMPPDTTKLLSSERCGAVVEAIRALPHYDLILFDTPPAFLLSDPVLLAEHLDGLLFVVGMQRVNRDLPGLALERMQETGVDVLGVLANQPATLQRRSHGYGYGYRYGYGYGYANGYSGYQQLASRYVDVASTNGNGLAAGAAAKAATASTATTSTAASTAATTAVPGRAAAAGDDSPVTRAPQSAAGTPTAGRRRNAMLQPMRALLNWLDHRD